MPDDGFRIGDTVERRGSDYRFPGVVVAVFLKLDGQRRYVVEDDRGILFIQSDKTLNQRISRGLEDMPNEP